MVRLLIIVLMFCDVVDQQQFVKHSNQHVWHQQLCSPRSKSPSIPPSFPVQTFALFVFATSARLECRWAAAT